MKVLWFSPGSQLSTTKNGYWKENVMTERSYAVLVLWSPLSAIYVPAQCFLSLAVERSWQSPPRTPVPWDLLRAVSGRLFLLVGVKLLPVPRGVRDTFTCLPATQPWVTLLLAGVGEPGLPSNQEDKVTCEMMESKGS